MKLLFIHQEMPGQFKHLAPGLAAQGDQVVFLTKRQMELPGVQCVAYAAPRPSSPDIHHYVRSYEDAVLHGQQVARACLSLRTSGFVPDVTVAHPGWGESLFIKDVFPRTRILSYCEFYYHGQKADLGFDPEFPATLDAMCAARARNAHLLLALEGCDGGVSPTAWQRSRHPASLQDKIAVIFDGIDTERVRPDSAATFPLPGGGSLTRDDAVVTYVARNLEPYRGFHSFMRAVPRILAARPDARIVIAGGDEVSYGNLPPTGGNWRLAMLDEIGGVDPARVHFLPKLPYGAYLRLLQVSRIHVYLTVPFVLSWSCMEALAAGCLVVGSRTAPVQEVIADGQNGLLADFLSPADIASRVVAGLEHPDSFPALRRQARETVLGRYDLRDCLRSQSALIRRLA